MALTSMKLTKAEAKAEHGPPVVMGAEELERFPFGLVIELDKHSLKKLGIVKLPQVGGKVTLSASAKVTRVSASASDSGENRSVSL